MLRGGLAATESRGGLAAKDTATLPDVVTGATKGGAAQLLRSIQYDAKGRIIAPVTAVDLSGITGLLKSTAGVFSAGAAGTDFVAPFGPHQTYREVGLALLGIARANAWETFENFMAMPGSSSPPASWLASASSASSSASNQVAGTQALSRIASGAAASGERSQSAVSYLGHQGTSKWYYAARFRVPTAIDAQARVLHALNSAGGNTVGIGIMGPVDTTNFVAYRDSSGFAGGTKLDLGVAIDNAFHTFEMWCVGDSILKARIDGGSTVTSTQVSAAADMFLFHTVRNGTTAADRQMDRRWFYMLLEAP